MKPTNEMITAATRLFAVMAAAEIATETYNSKQTQILEQLKLVPEDTKMLELYRTKGIEEPAYIQTDWDMCLLNIVDTSHPDFAASQFGAYHYAMDKAMQDAGFIHGANAAARANADVSIHKEKLFIAMQNSGQFPSIEWDDLTSGHLKFYTQFFDIALKMMAPYVDAHQDKNKISIEISKNYFSFLLSVK
jgi:hypothetical protein